MIPVYLEKLPRHHRLRKIEKTFARAEAKVFAENIFPLSAGELALLAETSELLAADEKFSADARKLFWDAAVVFREQAEAPAAEPRRDDSLRRTDALRRILNGVKHLLLNETGRSQADWDFTGSDASLPDGSGLDPAKRQVFEGMQVYLEDIRSPFNVGAMFRTAESFGVEKIFLSSFCADPQHRRSQRTAMGCVDIVPWERRNIISERENSALSCPVFALETGGIPITEFPFPRRGLLIAGSEELGVSPAALTAADASLGRVSIPCYGAKASLNVSVAFGIAIQMWAQAIVQKH